MGVGGPVGWRCAHYASFPVAGADLVPEDYGLVDVDWCAVALGAVGL